MLYEFDDVVQEMRLFILELINNIDLTKFPKDNSVGLTKYIAKSLTHKYMAVKKANVIGDNDLDISQFEFIVYDTPQNTIYVQEMLARLNKTQRRIVGYKLYGLSDVEIGELLGISRQAVNKTVRKVRTILKEYWEV